jgi:hypothetical protein
MTIAVGFVCNDGIVLAADTKESYGELHTFVHKLENDSPKCSGALAGSGYSYPADFIAPQIKETTGLCASAQPIALWCSSTRLPTVIPRT